MALTLAFIGGGKMGEALMGGLIARDWCPASAIGVVEPSEARRDALAATHPDLVFCDLAEVTDTDVVIAVKPNHVPEVAAGLAGQNIGRALSIAAGVTIARLEAGLGTDVRVIRAMPNTPALVGAGASAIAAGTAADADDLAWAQSILSSVGTVEVLPETLLDAVTGLSGSGPAYVFLMAEAMVAAGVEAGLPAETADALARQTLLGAARLLSESGEDPAQLRANVTSPNGTTAEGIAVLENQQLRAIVAEAVIAARDRSIELGQA